jgi:hypothetical protein
MRHIVSAITALSLVSGLSVHAQSAINGSTPNVTAPQKGVTENLSVTNGSRTSLSVGNATTFGASANLSASGGLTAISRTSLVPQFVDIESSIGKGAVLGKTVIDISNLTAKGGGTIKPDANGSTINSTEGQFASGEATIDGMQAQVDMTIGGSGANPGEAAFYAIVHPNIEAGTGSGQGACAPTNSTFCDYKDAAGLVSGNASANANLSTQTNIDIQANSFVQTFGQSF